MSDVFFERTHVHLKDDYVSESSQLIESCWRVASELARLLAEEGKKTCVKTIRGELDAEYEAAVLIPKPYGGRVRWDVHAICEASGIVYDPMLPEPMPLNEYLHAAFDQPVTLRIIKHIPQTQQAEFPIASETNQDC